MTILRRLANLLFAYDIVKKYNYDKRRAEEFRRNPTKIRWENLQNVSDRYKKLGFFPLPLTQEMFERHQVFLEPSDALKAKYPEQDPRTLRFEADAEWQYELEELEELEKTKDEQTEWTESFELFSASFTMKYARYEPNMKKDNSQ
jgi:Fe-S-cluster formation regulator IscX/YfhJ